MAKIVFPIIVGWRFLLTHLIRLIEQALQKPFNKQPRILSR